MEGRSFERFGAVCAALAGVAGFGYSTAFVIYLHNGARGAVYADSLLLIVGGLLSSVTFVALFGRRGRLTGALGFGRPRQVMQYRRMISERRSFEEALEHAADG